MKLPWFALVFLVPCVLVKAADDTSSSAKARAISYQAEVRAELIRHQWHVAAEMPGMLVLDHTLLDQGASSNAPYGSSGYTRAVIKFKAISVEDTACSASVSNYVAGYYRTADVKKYHGRVPTPGAPETIRMVESLINDARRRLLDAHPEYAVSATR